MKTSSKSDVPPRSGTVTALVAQADGRRRVNLFIDGEFALGISHDTLVRERLAVGVVIDTEAWQRLVASESADRALQAALRQLEHRPRTEYEVRQALLRRGVAEAQVEAVLRRLVELGLLDDGDFAQRYIAQRSRLSPRGSRALQAELRAHGIAAELAAQTVAERTPAAEADDLQRVAARAVTRYLSCGDWPTFQRRFGGFLLRRGFAAGAVQPLLRRLWQQAQQHDTADADLQSD